jgi:hypothetical protein
MPKRRSPKPRPRRVEPPKLAPLVSRRKLLLAAAVGVPGGLLVFSRKNADVALDPEIAEPTAARAREVERIVASSATTDGAGVHLKRAIGSRTLNVLDPFLLLDEFQSDDPNDYIAGFPNHPHRGFETVTYMIHGAMEHRDSVGNHGHLGPGSAQWMTAGSGIIHSEMPKQERGLMWGYQLWVNLPARRKLIRPRYQDIAPARIPELAHEGAQVRVVAGTVLGRTGPVNGIDVEPVFVDVALDQGAAFHQPLPAEHASFAYVVRGSVKLGPSKRLVRQGELAVLSGGELCSAFSGKEGGRFLLLAGRPLHEPVARSGPFVMNTDAEIRQAWQDYRSGRLIQG